jgi:uncharacterized membrane protein
MELWTKIAIVILIALLVYREIIKSASKVFVQAHKKQANLLSLIAVGMGVAIFVYPEFMILKSIKMMKEIRLISRGWLIIF